MSKSNARRLMVSTVALSFAVALTAFEQSPQPVVQAKPITALSAAKSLPVKGKSQGNDYDREGQFGSGWKDTDGNRCTTRQDVVKRDFRTYRVSSTDSCKVISGTWIDPYGGEFQVFTKAPSSLDADHIVPLKNAWQTGARQWSDFKRLQFANDPLNVVLTTQHWNRQKSDGDAATWLPPLKSIRCKYLARQVAVKVKYGLWTIPAEKETFIRFLSKPECSTLTLQTGRQRLN